MASWSDPITPVFSIVDNASTTDTSKSSTGVYDKNKTSVVTWTLNASLASTIGKHVLTIPSGSSQTFAGGAAAWYVIRIGSWGILCKSDNSAYTVAAATAAVSAANAGIGCWLEASDGVRRSTGAAWQTPTLT